MFTGLWPGFDTSEVPIGSITNGVHAPTWVAPEILSLVGLAAATGDWTGAEPRPASCGDPPAAARPLVAQTRRRLRASWRQRGASEAELGWIAACSTRTC